MNKNILGEINNSLANMNNTEIIKCRKLMCKKKRLSIEQCRCTLVKKCLFPTMKGEGLVLPAKGRECSEKEPV